MFGHSEQFSTFSARRALFTMLSPPVHARRMDQWTIYDMGVMYIGTHGSHTTWAKRSILR